MESSNQEQNASSILNEITEIKIRLFEVEEVKASERPLRERLSYLNGALYGIKETTAQISEELQKQKEQLK